MRRSSARGATGHGALVKPRRGMPCCRPPMNTVFSYGLILAAGNIVLTLVGFLLGYQTDKIAEANWFNLLLYALGIAVTWLGIKAVREEAKDKSLSYGKGVGSGVLIGLYSGILSSIYSFFHFKFINPDFGDYMMDMLHKKWAEAGFNDAQIESASKFMSFTFSPAMMSIIGLIYAVIFGLVVALIVSAFLKRAPQPASENPPPAT